MSNCQEVLRLLESDSNEVLREACFRAGDERCEEAVTLLAGHLTSKNIGVQEAAERALRRIGGKETIQAVIPLLRSDEAPLRNMSMDILREIGDQDFDSLKSLLHDDDADVRIFASDILGSIASLQAVAPLCESLLKDPEVNVRYQAAVSLGDLAFHEAAKCLNQALGDEEWVQFSVIEALAKIKDETSVAALVKALDKSSDLVASMIVEALGEMGNIKAVNLLLRRLDDSPTALRNKMVKAVVKILGGKSLTLLSPDHREKFRQYLLIALKDEEEEIQDAAIQGLGYVGGETASREVLDLAARLNPETAQERIQLAVDSLVHIGSAGVMAEALEAGDASSCAVAVEVLSNIGGARAEKILTHAFWNCERDVQRQIVETLAEIGTGGATPFFMSVLEHHEDGTVIKSALRFLGANASDEVAGDKIFELLEHPFDDVKEAALDACVAIGGTSMAERFGRFFESADPMRRLMAVFALGRLDAAANLDKLTAALGDEIPDIRKIALEALSELCHENKRVAALIVSGLEDDHAEVRLSVVELLGKCSDDDAVPHLLRALDDSDDWVRIRAMEALASRGEKNSVEKLVNLLGSPSKLLALKAVECLGTIGGQAAFRALLEVSGGEDKELQAAAGNALGRLQESGEGA